MQEDKQSLFESYDTVSSCVKIFTYMIESASWNLDVMENACKEGFLNATDVADYLVCKGMPFRTAHGVSASCVRLAIEKKCHLEDLSIEEFKSASPLFENDIYQVIEPKKCVNARKTIGGPAQEKVMEQISALKEFCSK
ncbi:MAG: argininosuccinate lyase, partial [Treponemataceae bacterium]|nr:argininosuccinate lyase [Treponemataceae bacterium]